MLQIERIQEALRAENFDGWLFYDFRGSNPIAYHVLELDATALYTRRWFYFIPATGVPTRIVSAVEPHVLGELPGAMQIFRDWRELLDTLHTTLVGAQRLAMEYSPHNAIPYVSRVDAGTIELIHSLGKEVVSSANLVAAFEARLTEEQIASHRTAGQLIMGIKDAIFAYVRDRVLAGGEPTEYEVQQQFLTLFRKRGLVAHEPPIVAVNEHSGDPHYTPTATAHSPIRRGDFLLVDFSSKLPDPDAVWADYTWVAQVDTFVPEHQAHVFEIVRSARDRGIAFLAEQQLAGKRIQGWQVDDVVRQSMHDSGYAQWFIHRTGHSIARELHANGANLDNLETHDERELLDYTCCSIEPGIYLPEFGVRSEVNVLLLPAIIEVTGTPVQEAIVPLLAE
jgi:Xaa-Pro dipeptidase